MSKSTIFKDNQRIEGTMLTVLRQADPGSSRSFQVSCDCGNVFVLSYMELYRCKFSCGCQRRTRVDAVDYAGFPAYNSAGNRRYGRKLTVICRDEATGQWWYLCHCCGTVSVAPRGMDSGLSRNLKDIAGRDCPNFRVYVPFDRVENLMWLIPDGSTRGGREKMTERFLKYIKPEQVDRDPKGRILGFWVPPDQTPKDYGCKWDNWAQEWAENAEETKPVDPDPDGFAAEMVEDDVHGTNLNQ